MADISLSKPVASVLKREKAPIGNIAYGLLVLFFFWAAAQLLSLVVHAPGVFEHLITNGSTSRPAIVMGPGVGFVFGLVPFLLGAIVLGLVALILRHRYH